MHLSAVGVSFPRSFPCADQPPQAGAWPPRHLTGLLLAATGCVLAEMTAVNIQTAAKLYTVTGVGYAPAGTITLTVPAPAPAASPAAGAQGPQSAAVAAATAAMAAVGPASAAGGAEVQQELSEAELAALRVMLEGAVLCNDSQLSLVTVEATGGRAAGYLGQPAQAGPTGCAGLEG